jgi:hypothetical protein
LGERFNAEAAKRRRGEAQRKARIDLLFLSRSQAGAWERGAKDHNEKEIRQEKTSGLILAGAY